jgi:hypothetical protein
MANERSRAATAAAALPAKLAADDAYVYFIVT